MRYRLTHQQLGLGPRPCHPKDRDESGFSSGSVDADRLSGLRRRALDIEYIVGDLKGETEIVSIAAQRRSRLARLLGENRTRLARKSDQGTGLHALQSSDRSDVQALMLGDQIDHLT